MNARKTTNTVAQAAIASALAVMGAFTMGASAPPGCIEIGPEPRPCALACADTPVCGVDGVTYDCGAPAAECAGVDVWYDGRCSECTSSEECGEGRHCSVDDGDCLPSPGCGGEGGALCPSVCGGVCIDDPAACTDDGDCGEREYCAFEVCPLAACAMDGWCPPCEGSCQPVPSECDSLGNDCADGGECIFEVCEAFECPPNADCAFVEQCYGHCGPPPPPPPPVECDNLGNECGRGESCVIDVCAAVDCPPNAMCEPVCWGHCEADPGQCEIDDDCGPGGYCEQFACECINCDCGSGCVYPEAW